MQNSLTYFGQLYGPYPHQVLRGVYHPRPFGQGFPTLLLLAGTQKEIVMLEHSFVAHETALQWWGGMASWRSYRDQWLSEAFAEYSGEIHTATRMNAEAGRDLVRRMRFTLQFPPIGEMGKHHGRVAEIGPIIFGNSSRHARDGQRLPSADLREGEDFRNLASTYFRRSRIGRQYNLKDLNWFFRQSVYEAYFPSYRLEDQSDGGVLVRGTIHQENAGDKWLMPLPVVVHFGKNKVARSVLYAYGEHKDFRLKLPAKPSATRSRSLGFVGCNYDVLSSLASKADVTRQFAVSGSRVRPQLNRAERLAYFKITIAVLCSVVL